MLNAFSLEGSGLKIQNDEAQVNYMMNSPSKWHDKIKLK